MIRVGRKRDQRDLLIRSLATSVILYESIITTRAKATMVQGFIDHIMTIAKSSDKLTARRRLLGMLLDENAVNKVLNELVTRTNVRTSGYTRRLRLTTRTGDGGDQVVLQLTDNVVTDKPDSTKTSVVTKNKDHNHA